MAGHTILLNLVGGVALLLWGSHMVQAAILKGFGDRIRGVISRAAGRPLRAAATGMAAATLLQSATATAVLVTAFVTRGLVALPAALALMLGADLGTTLVVQALSVNIGAAAPLLLLVGVVLARMAGRPKAAQVGRMLIGFGLILLALALIAAASAPMRESEVTALVLERLAHDPLLALIAGAVLTWVMHSSVAFVLFVISLSGAGLVGLPLALTLVLGANVGGGLIALGLAPGAPVAARRVLYGNLAFRAAGALVAFMALEPVTGLMQRLGEDAGRLAADFHTLFNLALVVVFLPLTAVAARLLERLFPEPQAGREAPRLDHLDPRLLGQPALALSAATRAMLGLADKVELMLREAILTFEDGDARRIDEVAALEEEVDADQEAIKLYLAQMMQKELTPEESAQVMEAVLFTTNLEHIGDIIDKGLLRLAAKKRKQSLSFSADGWRDIRAFHALIAEQMRRALAVFVTREPGLARELVAEKDRLREEEARASERHFRRLRDGLPETVETSALHLDVLRDLKRINAHLTTVAYPILEQTGELRGSRLRAPEPASETPRKAGKAQAARASSAG
jgi:phosphate:Na+ symporter